MPRTKRVIRRRYVEGSEILCSEIEETLLRGQGIIGTALELRTVEDWQRLWHRWGSVILPKALKAFPGTRPFAMYVVGEIPERPVLAEPPLVNGYFKLFVPGRNGTGRWHHQYPEPFQQSEPHYLHDIGLIDDCEWKRHRESQRRGNPPYRGPYHLGDYVLERGLYE
jgi:hypothetical protein